jgi:hypothetical protein
MNRREGETFCDMFHTGDTPETRQERGRWRYWSDYRLFRFFRQNVTPPSGHLEEQKAGVNIRKILLEVRRVRLEPF